MKSFAFIGLVALAVIFQSANSQVLRTTKMVAPIVGPAVLPSPCGCSSPVLPSCGCSSPLLPSPCGCSSTVVSPVLSAPVLSSPVVVPNIANNLADTLSLLTVSSLLAETLPVSYPGVVSLPVASGCGCGSYGYGPLLL